jgi:acyl-CoA synthetase
MTASGIIDLVPKTVRKKWADQGFYPNVSLFDAFYAQAQRQPSAPAVHDDKGTIVYSELLWHVKKLAAAFKQMGVVSGDVVAYQLPNSWQCCAIDLAVAALGAISCPLPVGRGRLDLEALIRRAHPRVVVMTESHGEYDYCAWVNTLKMTQLSLRHCIVDALSPQAKNNGENSDASWVCLQSLFEYEPIYEDALPKVDPDSPARFLISSGTESDPKLVAYSHNALLGGRGRFLQNIHNEDIAPIAFYMMPLASAFGSSATAGILGWGVLSSSRKNLILCQ